MSEATSTAPPTEATSPPAKRVKTHLSTMEAPPALQVKKLSDKARLPTRGSAFAAGYDLYAAKQTVVPARGKVLVDTDISIAVPAGTCTLTPPPPPEYFPSTVASAKLLDHKTETRKLTPYKTAALLPALVSQANISSIPARESLTPITAARSRSCFSTMPRPTLRSRRATEWRS